ncbi:TlpA family protein disulfide reductase [Haematospirillum sp. 15-248]|uniref:TlpA family protein disulfide reductase n=1 Tax=Haematospirillum sp. 15-248 TaxID=2723107 RepID=UPI001439D77A|nr:TlpA disulfide reductase family protein [Haematospirillum sp. 15-248]NKD88517.1 TlpA family protein disulfide reductase [Haematospirillum sp. 15-248]
MNVSWLWQAQSYRSLAHGIVFMLTLLPLQALAEVQDVGAVPGCSPFPSRKDGLVMGTLMEMVPPCQPPGFTFYGSDGREHTLDDFRGQPVLLNLWATWCTPCVREMPSLLQLERTRSQSGIRVIALNQDINGERAAAPFLEKNGWLDLGLWLDPKNHAAKALRAPGLPVSFLFNHRGLMVARLAGEADWSSAAMAEILKRLVEVPAVGEDTANAGDDLPMPSPEGG